MTSDTVLVAVFEPASSEGVEDVITDNYSIRARGGMIVVKDAEGEMLRIFDIQGRMIVSEKAVDGKQYTMPHTGVYMVQIGNHKAQKVVVVR